MNTTNLNNTDTLFAKIMPDVDTDHHGITLGDVIVLVLDAVLMIYTGYRSWHFLSGSIPADFAIMAIIGLWGLTIGAIAWSLVWIFGSTTQYQDWAAMTMFVVDLMGEVLTSVVDTLAYSAEAVMPPILQTVAWYGIPLIIIGNVVAGFVYHMTSPQTHKQRAERKMREAMERQRASGDLKLQRMALQLTQARDYTRQRAEFLTAFEEVASQNVRLDGVEKALQALMGSDERADTLAQSKLTELEKRLHERIPAPKGGADSIDPWPWATPVQRAELNRLLVTVTAALEAGDETGVLAAIGALKAKSQEFAAQAQASIETPRSLTGKYTNNGHKPERVFDVTTASTQEVAEHSKPNF